MRREPSKWTTASQSFWSISETAESNFSVLCNVRLFLISTVIKCARSETQVKTSVRVRSSTCAKRAREVVRCRRVPRRSDEVLAQ